MYPQAVFLHGMSHVSIDHVLLQRDAWKQAPKHDSGVFFAPTASDCSLTAPLGSVERIFPCDLLPPLVRSSPTLCLKTKLSRWSSLSLLSHVHTDTHTYTSIMTHLHLPTSAVSHRSNSPCSHRPLLVVASSCWLTTNKNISSLVCLRNRKILSLDRLLRWFLCQKWCSPLKKEERSSRWGSSSSSWGLTWEQHGDGRLMARSSCIQCPGGGGVCSFSL